MGVSESRKAQFGSNKMSEYRASECWDVRVLVYRILGMSKYWDDGVLARDDGILGCRSTGMMRYCQG